jgi:hypothetical protein
MSDLEVKSVLKTERQEGGHWEASIEGVGAIAHGETRAEAIEGLCCLLGDFVKGHAGTIDQLQQELLGTVGLSITQTSGSAIAAGEPILVPIVTTAEDPDGAVGGVKLPE